VLNFLNILLSNNNNYNNQSLSTLITYPNIIKEFGDNSDNKAVNFPLRKVFKSNFFKPLKSRLVNKDNINNSVNIEDTISGNNFFVQNNLNNIPTSSKEFMINYSFQNIPFGKQTPLKHKNLTENTTNYNLSLGLNSLDSNLIKTNLVSNFTSPLYTYSLQKSN
jgi:hypothetical protein